MAVVISGKQSAATNSDQTSTTVGVTHSNSSGDQNRSPLLSTEANELVSRSEMKAKSEV